MSHSQDEFEPNEDTDVAPGVMSIAGSRVRQGIQGYLIGLALAALLTVAAFSLVGTDVIWPPAIPVALGVLAVAQIGVHLVFFLHITTAPDNANNILALAFGIVIVVLVVAGSIWIMDHLNQNMVPMGNLMNMQR